MSETTIAEKTYHNEYIEADVPNDAYYTIDFSGFRSREMEEELKRYEHKRYSKYNYILKENEDTIKALQQRADSIEKQIEGFNSFYRLLHHKKLAKMLALKEDLLCSIDGLKCRNHDLLNDSDYASDSNSVIKAFLMENKFVLKSTSYWSSKYDRTETEVWIREG